MSTCKACCENNGSEKKRLRIAIQKSGRLTDETLKLFKDSGIKISSNRDHLLAHAENLPIDILRVRDDDIPGLVMDHVVDWGIVGQNVLEETTMQRELDGMYTGFNEVLKLNFGDCRLSVAVPTEEEWHGLSDLEGKKIATTYPHLLRRVMKNAGVNFRSVLLTGSVEVAPRAGLADAICDLVCTGATLQSNGLKEVETIYTSKAVLIGRDQPLFPEKQAIADTIIERFKGVMSAVESRYIMMNAPKAKLEQIRAILPGAENPSIIELEGSTDRVALHAVSREKVFWETLEQLKALGATSILVVPIEKMLG
ncbi:ATP phosphoribosyltransferase [Succinivibrio dextrinosolvens]|uniref:ATP phosphoribosyltransferase n=1 Tax=Succinivibrio dextrinosolvens TaxID=83771 RepID=UPI0008EDA186|nr:ATP phosphoribosyltransferase [Succinivibrio dextrinosolvens]SFS33873.1 ATP phosphoribosyltransferase [Succinivibrio dextrinosolvens]